MMKLQRFGQRLEKLGIKIELAGNYPWVYLRKINGKRVTEKFHANHGFTVLLETTNSFTDLREIFKIIRKYR